VERHTSTQLSHSPICQVISGADVHRRGTGSAIDQPGSGNRLKARGKGETGFEAFGLAPARHPIDSSRTFANSTARKSIIARTFAASRRRDE
jgi:hypothetical protein